MIIYTSLGRWIQVVLRLLHDQEKKECETSDISRDELWCKAHIRKNGEPLNSVVADCISHRESNNLTINEQPNRNARQTQNESRKCKLLSWEKQVVAEGTVASTDPNCLVHFKKLGPDGCKVWVDVAVDPGAFLRRPNFEMCTIGEAVGSTVAWHKDFLAFD